MSKDLREYSVGELREFKKTLDPEKVGPETFDQLDALILSKEVDSQIGVALHSMRKKEAGLKFDEQAYKDWPELRNEESDMYKEVQTVLKQDPDYLTDPKALKNAAMEVGLGMGLTPAGFQPTKGNEPMPGIGGGESGKPSEGEESGEEHMKRTSAIGEAFGEMLDLKDKDVRARVAGHFEEGDDNG